MTDTKMALEIFDLIMQEEKNFLMERKKVFKS